ncbi:MAG TPA: DNA primase [Flavobacterium sp.]|jgi:DNA-directed RNA polymerase subunit delta|uniref:DNA primase n=1 Tax=Flavobacterium sp. TaxID=239 RepID=UPI002C80FD0B|nr:DNA primase [Flavobacterium sp.]MCA0350336.1 DNA primase [Bacteroidota bacterium]HPW99039.1 DNA primase [Flavobacterium sp.]HQA74816.1 DNA primase [Flavobacterium sp.]
MKRIIVDYAKLTGDILNLLVEKFPEGYDDSDIIRFRNAQNELIEAVEVRTEDTIYLVKVSTKLASRMEKYDEDDDIDSVIEPIAPGKGIDLDDDDLSSDDEDDEVDLLKDKGGSDDDDDADDDDDFSDSDNFDEDDDGEE